MKWKPVDFVVCGMAIGIVAVFLGSLFLPVVDDGGTAERMIGAALAIVSLYVGARVASKD